MRVVMISWAVTIMFILLMLTGIHVFNELNTVQNNVYKIVLELNK